MCFKSFFKLSIPSFVEEVTLYLVFVFSLFLLTFFYCTILLFSIAFAHLCQNFCTSLLPILDTYFNLLKVSLLILQHTRDSFLPKNIFLRVFAVLIFPYSSRKSFNSSSDISDPSSFMTSRLAFFLHDFSRWSFDPRVQQVFVSWGCFFQKVFLCFIFLLCTVVQAICLIPVFIFICYIGPCFAKHLYCQSCLLFCC